MHPELLKYLEEQRVGVLSVQMKDGSPHGATVHFVATQEPFTLLFLTSATSRKSEAFADGKKCRATFVIGTDEATMKTMQCDGEAEVVQANDIEEIQKTYLVKFPEKINFIKGHGQVIYIKFTPTWWRYSDFKRAEGKLVVTSE